MLGCTKVGLHAGEAPRVNGSACAARSKLQMLSIGGVRMTPAAAHEQVTDLTVWPAKVQEPKLMLRGCVLDAWAKRFEKRKKKKSLVSSLMKHSMGYLAK